MTQKDELRQRAEKALRDNEARTTEYVGTLSPAAARQALHELRVHQVELEMQNEELCRAQAELHASRARYFDLYDLAPVGYLTLSERGLIVEANLTASTLLGAVRGALVKQPIARFILSDDQDVYYLYRQQTLEKETAQACELRMVRKDGTVFWAHLEASAAPEPDGARTCRIVMSDITERKLADTYRELDLEVLRILNESDDLQVSVRSVLAAVKTRIGVDAVGLRLQGAEDFPYFAQEGFPKDFLLADSTVTAHKSDGGVWRDKDGHVILGCACGLVLSGKCDPSSPCFTRGGSFWTNNAFALGGLPSGQGQRLNPCNPCMSYGYASLALVPLRDKERIVGLIHLADRRKGCFTLAAVEQLEGLVVHIGEAFMRKQAEQKVRESDVYIRAVMDSLPIGIAVNSVAGAVKFSYMNANFPKFYRTTREALADPDAFWEAVYEDPVFRQEIRQRVLEDCASGDPERMHWEDIPITRKGEETRFIAAMNTPLPGKQLMISTVWDVTERKRALTDLLNMRTIQSVGTLAGGIAHDFNNILLGLFGNISLAKAELPEGHPGYALLGEAEKAMNRAVRLTKQLLTFAKGGDPVKENVNLGALSEDVARFDLSGSTVCLVVQQAEDLWSVEADKGQIQQVISNLALNARQAMPAGGHLYITLENTVLPEAAVSRLPKGKYVKVTVRDEGGGIDPKVIDRIFDPYFTTKVAGHGLGLATVYSIISKHGGHIGVVSEPGRGTAFTFYLPASGCPARAETGLPAAGDPPPASRSRILVMDDDETVCALVVHMLTPCGFSVATAPDGQKAIAMYRQALAAGEPFDVVIMDLTVPGGLGGQEAVKELLAIDPHVRAIVSSGYADDPVMANPAQYGFKGVAAKPYSLSMLTEVVRQVLQG